MMFHYMFRGEEMLDVLLWLDEWAPTWNFADIRRTDYPSSYKEHVGQYFRMINNPRGIFNKTIHILDKDEAILFKLTWMNK